MNEILICNNGTVKKLETNYSNVLSRTIIAMTFIHYSHFHSCIDWQVCTLQM